MQALVVLLVAHPPLAVLDAQVHGEIEMPDASDVRPVLEILLDQQVRPCAVGGPGAPVLGAGRDIERQRSVRRSDDPLPFVGIRDASVRLPDRRSASQIVPAGPLGHLPDGFSAPASETDRVRVGLFESAVVLHDRGPKRRDRHAPSELRVAQHFSPFRFSFVRSAVARVGFRFVAVCRRQAGKDRYGGP